MFKVCWCCCLILFGEFVGWLIVLVYFGLVFCLRLAFVGLILVVTFVGVFVVEGW